MAMTQVHATALPLIVPPRCITSLNPVVGPELRFFPPTYPLNYYQFCIV
jgi:hypothetical protein